MPGIPGSPASPVSPAFLAIPTRIQGSRRPKPAAAAAAGLFRAAASSLVAARELGDEAAALLASGQRQLVLSAVLPGAQVLRGDGELLSALAAELAGRVQRYLSLVEDAQ